MSTNIHPTAIVDPKAELDASVTVGPYTLVGPHVKVGAGTTIAGHVVIEGHTTIGRDNRIFQFASIGAANQDKKYKGEPTELVIGDRNTIREFTTLQVGTVQDKAVTTIGNDCWIMAYCHVAHDCIVGNNTHGQQRHVEATWSRATGSSRRPDRHSPVRGVGPRRMLGFASAVSGRPAFMLVDGDSLAVRGVNAVGCAAATSVPSASPRSSRCTSRCTAKAHAGRRPRRSPPWRKAPQAAGESR
jgi:UDP-N-acetylglucosamine acyltransferase